MVSGRDAPGRASHVKSSSYCDSVHTLMLFSPPSGTIPLEEVESAESSPRPKRQQQQSNSGSSTPRSRTTKPGPLKILVRAFNACRRGRGTRSKETVLPPTPRAASPGTPTMSAHEAAAIRRLLAVPSSRHSLTFASNWSSSSTTSLALPSEPTPTTWPSVSSRSSSSTYYTAASSIESPYPSLRHVHTTQAQHPYALAAPVYE